MESLEIAVSRLFLSLDECYEGSSGEQRMKKTNKHTDVDTIIVIGNGFDIWQGLDTNYLEFRKYYLSHRAAILRSLHIKPRLYIDEQGKKRKISDVELIYGDPFEPRELEADFWGCFEYSLDELDAERLNLFFGKDRKGLREMQRSIRNADRILRKAFCDWIATIVIDERESGYRFGENCLIINFNYTDTLLKRFRLNANQEFHIHGEASDRDSIIFGHASHPQLPEDMLYQLGGRFRGLYLVEKILYETDKHVQDQLQLLCMFLAMHGVMKENIKDIYVLGHSMSMPDMEYFAFFMDATRVPKHSAADTEQGPEPESDPDTLDALHNRMQYAIRHGGYQIKDSEIEPEYRDAVMRQFAREQKERSDLLERDFFRMLQKKQKPDRGDQQSPANPERTEDARWHITCFKDKDRQWIEGIMKIWECENYVLYPSIDECLKPFAG